MVHSQHNAHYCTMHTYLHTSTHHTVYTLTHTSLLTCIHTHTSTLTCTQSLTHITLLTCIHTHTSTQAEKHGTHSSYSLSHAYILTQAHRQAHTHTHRSSQCIHTHTRFRQQNCLHYFLTLCSITLTCMNKPDRSWNVYQKIQAEDLGHSSGHHSSANNVISKISYMNRSTNTHCSWSWCKLHRYTALQVAMLLTESHGNIIPSALLPLSL